MSTASPTPVVPDPRAIFRCAEAFRRAIDWLSPGDQPRPKMWSALDGRSVEYAAPDIPYIVCDAMNVELYLKCLHVLDHGAFKTGHDTAKLFASLKPTTRRIIAERYDIQVGAAQSFLAGLPPNYRAVVVELDKYLQTSRFNFENMRYLYERPQGDMAGFPFLGRALREAILSIKPEWA